MRPLRLLSQMYSKCIVDPLITHPIETTASTFSRLIILSVPMGSSQLPGTESMATCSASTPAFARDSSVPVTSASITSLFHRACTIPIFSFSARGKDSGAGAGPLIDDMGNGRLRGLEAPRPFAQSPAGCRCVIFICLRCRCHMQLSSRGGRTSPTSLRTNTMTKHQGWRSVLLRAARSAFLRLVVR